LVWFGLVWFWFVWFGFGLFLNLKFGSASPAARVKASLCFIFHEGGGVSCLPGGG